MPGALLEILKSAPLSDGKVSFAWRTAVGPALARVTAVRLAQGTLIVETASAQWTREIQRSSRIIVGRLQPMLGINAIARLEVRTNPNLKSEF